MYIPTDTPVSLRGKDFKEFLNNKVVKVIIKNEPYVLECIAETKDEINLYVGRKL